MQNKINFFIIIGNVSLHGYISYGSSFFEKKSNIKFLQTLFISTICMNNTCIYFHALRLDRE